MKESGRKGSGGPVIASRSEAIQRFLSGLPRGWSPLQWRLIPRSNHARPPFFDKRPDWPYL